jgi:hypothetical protein
MRKFIYELHEPALLVGEDQYYLVIRFRDGVRLNIQIFFRSSALNQDRSPFEEVRIMAEITEQATDPFRSSSWFGSRGGGGDGSSSFGDSGESRNGSLDTQSPSLALPRLFSRPHEESVRPGDGHCKLGFSCSMTSRLSIVPTLR